MLKSVILSASALALSASPVAASAAPLASSPAGKLSLSSTVRADTQTGKSNRLAGAGAGPIAAAVIGAGILIGAVFLIEDEESEDDADSN